MFFRWANRNDCAFCRFKNESQSYYLAVCQELCVLIRVSRREDMVILLILGNALNFFLRTECFVLLDLRCLDIWHCSQNGYSIRRICYYHWFYGARQRELVWSVSINCNNQRNLMNLVGNFSRDTFAV